jgi:CRISPR/Cas system CSM-associated protein Csm3 (group 7 of RAMP superfamily)
MTRRSITVALTALEPLRIGGVENPLSGVHNPVTSVGGRLVVPGPSLKGVLRNEVERYLVVSYWKANRWDGTRSAYQPCIPAPRPTLDEQKLVEAGKYRRTACRYPSGRGGTPDSICPVCYFFGAMGVAGFARIPFLVTESGGDELYSSRMDRGVNTVVEGTNRPYQLVPDGARFTGTLDILIEDPVLGWKLGKPRPFPAETTKGDEWLKGNEQDPDRLVKEFLVDRLTSISLLGGYKSKGFGKVKIEVTPTE